MAINFAEEDASPKDPQLSQDDIDAITTTAAAAAAKTALTRASTAPVPRSDA